MDQAVAKYLETYAEPVARGLIPQNLFPRQFRSVLIIPAFDEADNFLDGVLATLVANKGAEGVLVIVVVNAPDNAEPDALMRTRQLLSSLRGTLSADLLHVRDGVLPVAIDHAALLTVDAVSPGRQLPHKQGVGLARKIGADIALSLHAAGLITSPWLMQTDADAVLPDDYFATPERAMAAVPAGHGRNPGAMTFGFCHVATRPSLATAVACYDAHLRYFVAGLQYAGSRWAFPSLGSALAIHAAAYARVRGYPRRNAGEDFHLLGKIAKISDVLVLDSPVVQLAGRESHRVPFGTGPAITRFLLADSSQAKAPDADSHLRFLTYSPNSFVLLAAAHAALNRLANESSPHAGSGALASATKETTPQQAPQQAPQQERRAELLLAALGVAQLRKTLSRLPTGTAANQTQRHARVKDWFDALKTLQFMHAARRYHADVPIYQASRELPGFAVPDLLAAKIAAHRP